MAATIDQYLFYLFNRRTAEFWANAPGATWSVHLGKGKKKVTRDLLTCDLIEPSIPDYSPFETSDVIIIDNDDGTVMIVIENVEFDFDDGPSQKIKSNWLWVTYRGDGIEEIPIGGIQLPATVDFDEFFTYLRLTLRIPFGALDPSQIIGPAACPEDIEDSAAVGGDADEQEP